MKQIEIDTKRLRLRPLRASDLDSVFQYRSDAETTKYLFNPPNTERAETLAFLKKTEAEWLEETPKFLDFAVELQGRQIGEVFLTLDADRTGAEIGWILHRPFWGKGYATEAALAVKKLAPGLQIGVLHAHCDARNLASAAIMRRLGMQCICSTGTRVYERTGETAAELEYRLILPRESDPAN